MATIVHNQSAGPIDLPDLYGGGEVGPGQSVIVADTVANVAAAFGGLDANSGIGLVQTADGQHGAISPISGGAGGGQAYVPGDATGWSPAPATIAQGLDQMQVKSKFLLAGFDRVHMLADAADITSLTALVPLVPSGGGAATLPQALARFTALQALAVDHFQAVGTIYVDGEHYHTDTVNHDALAAEAPISLPTLETSIHNFAGYIVAHGNASTVHFHDDAGTGGTGFTVTTDPPTTLAQCSTDLNDIRQGLLTHFARGSQ